MKIRNLKLDDYSQYLRLIDSSISNDNFNSFVNDTLNEQHVVLVVINEKDIIIGSGTLLIEEKLTHNGCRMGHIENILISPEHRGLGLGEKLVKKLLKIAKEKSCYRTDLNCDAELEDFYSKSGFKKNQISMSVYYL
tara:strand:- start:196 stop:606 length:411 start_codon:yes stop_codon:yes gene_type:complete